MSIAIVNEIQRPDLGPRLAAAIGIQSSADFRALALVDGDDIIGIVGYNGWFCGLVAMHAFIPQPKRITRGFIKAMFEYPFNKGNVLAVIAVVEAGNARALRLNEHVGFSVLDRYDNGTTLMQMKRGECRWIEEIQP